VIADHIMFTGVNILLAWSVYVILLSGSVSFANGAFMAIGGYGAGVFTTKFGLPLFVGIPIAALGTAAFGMIIGLPALRTRGIYLILVTTGIAFCVKNAIEAIPYVGGVRGMRGLVGAEPWHVWVIVAVVGLLLWLLSRTALQRILDATREDELVARSLGVNTVYVKVIAFGAGAALAAVAGGLYAHYMYVINPEHFGILVSVYVVLYVIMGGVNNMWGPPLGAAVMTLLPELIRGLQAWRPIVFGIVIVVLLLVRPEGLLPFRSATARAKDAQRD
jgi:branched-chain amino acid transport system permease protein